MMDPMIRRLATATVAVIALAAGACSDDAPSDVDAAIDAPVDAEIDAPDGPPGRCPGELFFTGGYFAWDSTGQIPGINASTWTVRGQPARTDESSPNGRVELCLEPTALSTIDATTADHVAAIYVALPAVFEPANTSFDVKGITTARAATFYASLGLTFDMNAGHVLIEKKGSPIPLTLSAGGTAFAVDDVNDNSWTAGNSGGLVLFANVPLGAGTTTLSSTSTFIGPTTLPLEAGKLTITTIR